MTAGKAAGWQCTEHVTGTRSRLVAAPTPPEEATDTQEELAPPLQLNEVELEQNLQSPMLPPGLPGTDCGSQCCGSTAPPSGSTNDKGVGNMSVTMTWILQAVVDNCCAFMLLGLVNNWKKTQSVKND